MMLRIFTVLFCLFEINAVLAAEIGYTYRDTELKSKPFTDASTVVTLPEKTPVEILVRKGAWMQVKQQDGKARGWVRMLSIRLGSAGKKPSNGSLLTLIGIGNRPKPQTTATVTTGVRGFSEEDLKTAEPNPKELEKMEGLAVSEDQAKQFASEGNLSPHTVSYFDKKGKPVEAGK